MMFLLSVWLVLVFGANVVVVEHHMHVEIPQPLTYYCDILFDLFFWGGRAQSS